MDDELLDLVDRNDKVVGTINRQDYKILVDKKLGYIRAVDLFILNSKGQIYVPVRTSYKAIAPNGFDYGAGGHVSAGEDYLTSLVREVREELNITVSSDKVEFFIKNIYDDLRYIQCVYVLQSDDTPNFNTDDFVSAKWMDPSKLIDEINNGHPAKTGLKENTLALQERIRLDT